MTEPGPVSFSLLGAAVAVLGPVLGPYALIVFAAGIGAGLALSVEEDRQPLGRLQVLAAGHRHRPDPHRPRGVGGGALQRRARQHRAHPRGLRAGRGALAHRSRFVNHALDAIAAAFNAALQAAANRRGGGQ
jgi:hypothetical protein